MNDQTTMTTTVEVRERALAWPDRARAAEVRDADSYCAAGELLKGIKALRQEIAETFDPHIRRAHEAHRALLKEKADAEAPLTEAERVLKSALVRYDDVQERMRREEQRRRDEEARRHAEAEALARAAALEREGHASGDDTLVLEAEQIVEAQIQSPPPVAAAIVPRATPKIAGIVHRSTWSAEVTDLAALVRFVAANPSHLGLLQPNQTALNAQARSLKAAMRIPGVRPIESRDVAAWR